MMLHHCCFSRHNSIFADRKNTRQRDNFLHRRYKKSITNVIDKNITQINIPLEISEYSYYTDEKYIHTSISSKTREHFEILERSYIDIKPYQHRPQYSSTSYDSPNILLEEVKQIPDICPQHHSYNCKIVLQCEASFGHTSLGTFGIGPCVAVAGLDRFNNICFVTHLDALTEIVSSLSGLVHRMKNTYIDKELNFDVVIIGGQDYSRSDMIINKIYRFLTQNYIQELVKINFIGKNIMGTNCRTIGVDMNKLCFCEVIPSGDIPNFDSRMRICEMSSMFGERQVSFV